MFVYSFTRFAPQLSTTVLVVEWATKRRVSAVVVVIVIEHVAPDCRRSRIGRAILDVDKFIALVVAVVIVAPAVMQPLFRSDVVHLVESVFEARQQVHRVKPEHDLHPAFGIVAQEQARSVPQRLRLDAPRSIVVVIHDGAVGVKIRRGHSVHPVQWINRAPNGQVGVGACRDDAPGVLGLLVEHARHLHRLFPLVHESRAIEPDGLGFVGLARERVVRAADLGVIIEIGRASCRERV